MKIKNSTRRISRVATKNVFILFLFVSANVGDCYVLCFFKNYFVCGAVKLLFQNAQEWAFITILYTPPPVLSLSYLFLFHCFQSFELFFGSLLVVHIHHLWAIVPLDAGVIHSKCVCLIKAVAIAIVWAFLVTHIFLCVSGHL